MENYPLTYLIIRKLFPRVDYYYGPLPAGWDTRGFRWLKTESTRGVEVQFWRRILIIELTYRHYYSASG